jgi:heme-degrading monooxygenase HmoA
MYAMYSHRKQADDPQQLRGRAEKELFPKMRQAPGFISMTLIEGEDGQNLAVVLWERREDAAAFQADAQRWAQVMDESAPLVSRGQGEVAMHVTPQTPKQA